MGTHQLTPHGLPTPPSSHAASTEAAAGSVFQVTNPALLRRGEGGRGKGGFSLVEVVLSIGVVAFALMALLGLIPTGLKTFKSTMNTAVGSQIAERVFNDMQVTDWTNLVSTNHFYDEQGSELTDSNAPNCIYWVQVSVTNSATGTNSTRFMGNTSANLMTVTILIANNPGHSPNAFSATNPNTITFTSLMGRNR